MPETTVLFDLLSLLLMTASPNLFQQKSTALLEKKLFASPPYFESALGTIALTAMPAAQKGLQLFWEEK